MTLVDPPRVARHEFRTLSPEEARALLSALHGDGPQALYVLARRPACVRASSWRCGGATWICPASAWPYEAVCIGIRAAAGPSVNPRRSAPGDKSCCHRWPSRRWNGTGSGKHEERLQIGPAWEENDLVFANHLGRPLSSQNLTQRHFYPLLQRLSLPKIRFHDLRHTAATLLLAEGIHPKVVSEMLGHTQVGITLDLHSHVTPAMHESATRALGSCSTSPPSRREGMTAPTSGGRYDDVSVGGRLGFRLAVKRSSAPRIRRSALVAQGIEHRFPKPCVAGSNPAEGTAFAQVIPEGAGPVKRCE